MGVEPPTRASLVARIFEKLDQDARGTIASQGLLQVLQVRWPDHALGRFLETNFEPIAIGLMTG